MHSYGRCMESRLFEGIEMNWLPIPSIFFGHAHGHGHGHEKQAAGRHRDRYRYRDRDRKGGLGGGTICPVL